MKAAHPAVLRKKLADKGRKVALLTGWVCDRHTAVERVKKELLKSQK